MAFKKSPWAYKNKDEALKSAKRFHVCLSCRYHQTENYKTCPECGSKNRQYFMSKAEFERGMTLLTLQMGKTISRLRFQPRFDLIVNGIKIGTYVGDADYYRDGVYVVEDVKGNSKYATDLSKWKIAHFEAQYQIKIKIEQKKKIRVNRQQTSLNGL